MCGRARCSLAHEEVASTSGVDQSKWRDADKYTPKYNMSPGSKAPVIRKDKEGELGLQTMTWGLVPSWTKPGAELDFYRMFNARSETVPEKGVFKRLLEGKRCVVLLNGFYEWAQEGKAKQPYYVHLAGDRVLRMAGLYDACQVEEDEWLHTFTILTTDSSKRLSWLHNRMPVILPDKDAEEVWLANGEVDTKKYWKLCLPYNEEDLQWHPVDPQMSKPHFQGPDCSKPLKRPNIANFFKAKPAPVSGITREAVGSQPCGKGVDKEEQKSNLIKAEAPTPEAVKPEEHAEERLKEEEAVKNEDGKEEPVKDEPEMACTSAAEPCSPASSVHEQKDEKDTGARQAASPASSPKKRGRSAGQDSRAQGGSAKKAKASPAGGGKEGAAGKGKGKGLAPGQSSLDSFFIKNPA